MTPKPGKSNAKNPVSITLPSDPRYLRVLRCVLESIAAVHEIDDDDIRSIILAANEAYANIIKHSYGDEPGHAIYLKVEVTPTRYRIEFEDDGKPLEPDKIHSRELDDVKPGGLGVHLMQCMMDEVIFDAEQSTRNRLVLTKELKRSDERDD